MVSLLEAISNLFAYRAAHDAIEKRYEWGKPFDAKESLWPCTQKKYAFARKMSIITC
jgi:hypothetical protein